MSDTINAMRTGIIYGYTNLESGKMYIGQTLHQERRWNTHRYGKYKNGWHKDYQNNPDKYEYSVIEYDVPEDKLDEREMFWIKFFDSYRNGYNLTPGGDGMPKGYKLSDETKHKMSKAKKGENNPMYGKHLSEETRKKMRGENNPMYGKNRSGENNPFYGKHHTEETKQKISVRVQGENHPNFGKHFYTDGNKNIVAYECPEGFKPGKTIFKNKKCT